ncbi:hypothetical protein [Thalassomonas actiniarum]|uniref:Uncharacterized protein n=1 Tax=Thalassomonas actiniarum TaxID=485447 RepID=A0AAE9YQ03_9GAMM|nr:hypothetical protein [Thalassomonas actiniarum]WDD97436.1 hypothetical protein SG35_019220 [Thalassomonas actiniarum]
MSKIQDKDTRYFIEINLATLKVTRCGYDQKENLDKGRQTNPAVHRLFVTEGQFNKMVERCGKELESIIET